MSPKRDVSEAGNWEAHASDYADRATSLTEPFARDLVHAITPKLQDPATRVVLDVACGGGAFALAYLSRFPHGIAGQTVRCTDISPTMVKSAQAAMERVLEGRPCKTRFEFGVEDATKLSGVADGSVHALVSVFGVFLVPDRGAVFRQIQRVLAKDVPSIFATTAWTDLPAGMSPETMQDTAMTAVGICHPEPQNEEKALTGDPEDESKPWLQWSDPSGAERVVKEAGMREPRVFRSIHTLCTGDKHDLWMTMTRANPMVNLEGRSDEDIAAMKEKFIDAIAKRDYDGPIFMIAAANVVTAIV